MAAVAGLRGTGDWGTDERPKNFRELILWRNPNGSAPIFALMSRVQKESVDDPEFSWWDEPNDLLRLEVNGALVSGDTTIVVDGVEPSASSPGLVWGSAQHLVPGDLLFVEPAVDAAVFTHEIIEVVSVTSATSFTVKRAAAGTAAAAIGDGLFLLKIGSAHAEGTPEADSSSRNPIKYSNFTQIFKTTYEVTKTAAATRARTGDILKNERRRKSFDHSRDLELAILFGQKSEVAASTANGKPIRTMDGIRKFISAPTTTILQNSWDLTHFLDAVTPVFDFESPAGDTRIAMCGNSALNFLNKKIGAGSGMGAIQVNFTGPVKMFGMNFQEYVLPQGRLLLKTHPLMNRHGLYKNSMFILDFANIRYRPLRGRDTDFQDNIQDKGEDSIRGQWLTEASIEVRAGGLTQGYIGGFNL